MHSGWVVVVLAMLALVSCGSASSGGGGLGDGDGAMQSGGAACSALCARQATASCQVFSPATCMDECFQSLSYAPCVSQVTAAIHCAATATWYCDRNGTPESRDCAAESGAISVCVAANITLRRDASVMD
jgi:hypothetical protein